MVVKYCSRMVVVWVAVAGVATVVVVVVVVDVIVERALVVAYFVASTGETQL